MIVVADTSPLNYLIRLGHAEVLHLLYRQVVVPTAVLTEMQHPDAPSIVSRWIAAPPSWLQEIAVQYPDRSLTIKLGAGESEAISLALELGADVLLIDDLEGRREAEKRHLAVAGTLAVLLQASMSGYLEFPEELDRLRQLGFRFSVSVEADMIARYEKARETAS